METRGFKGRTLAVIRDFSLEERRYVFKLAREFKQLLKSGNQEGLNRFRIKNPDFGVYEVFLEDSTRTKESFKNAADFHRIKVNILDTDHSSFNKNESYSDTFNTLAGYNNSVFIIRSRLEGVCRWLEENGRTFAGRNGFNVPPAFINAGDGMHEHPTQELLDEFTFLEKNNWDYSSLHIALVGDLFHGRTVHSKADGLGIFGKVRVDLVAPPELSLPGAYFNKMRANGYILRTFSSIEEYLKQNDAAPILYFTRPQLERMGEDVLKRQEELRRAIVFKKDYLPLVEGKAIFYHPLPRHKTHPTIPTFLDATSLNGWEEQSVNGMIIRIILLGLIEGSLGGDFCYDSAVPSDLPGLGEDPEDFLEEAEVKENGSVKDYAEGVKPISDGLVIDHICRGESEAEVRAHVARIIQVLGLHGKGGEWISASRDEPGKMKGIIFRPGAAEPNISFIKQLAALAPGATVNIIRNRQVVKKLRLHMPPRIYNFDSIGCRNSLCISNPVHGEGVPAEFLRISGSVYTCKYCEHPHSFKEIWK